MQWFDLYKALLLDDVVTCARNSSISLGDVGIELTVCNSRRQQRVQCFRQVNTYTHTVTMTHASVLGRIHMSNSSSTRRMTGPVLQGNGVSYSGMAFYRVLSFNQLRCLVRRFPVLRFASLPLAADENPITARAACPCCDDELRVDYS